MLDLYQTVLDLKFTEVDLSKASNALTWHQDVRLIEVRDASTGEFVGQFYLDLFPREGKYTHA
ncbi:hypothetical protein HK102_002023, partial [Quaeritorhiza haematococci]